MVEHQHISASELWELLRRKKVTLAGNKKLGLYGSLHCRSGKRMKRENRVFFVSEAEAILAGYRPCAHCMKQAYQHWKKRHGSL